MASAVFLVLGICGVYGAIKSKKKQSGSGNCLLFIYFLGIFAFFVVFLAGTIFFFVGPHTIFGTSCQHGAKTTLIDNLYDLNSNATKDFGNASCQIFLKTENTNSELAAYLNASGKNITTNNGHVNYQSCLT